MSNKIFQNISMLLKDITFLSKNDNLLLTNGYLCNIMA